MSKADDILNISQGNQLTKMRMAGHNLNNDRQKDDFYPTPPDAIYPLLEREKFEGEIWECACGDGAISNILKEYNYNVYSSDLINRNYGETGVDFLKSNKKTHGGGMLAFAWYIWERGYEGKPYIEWI